MSQFYFLRRLRSHRVFRTMLNMFYQSVVASSLYFAVACWDCSVKMADSNRVTKQLKWAGLIMGVNLDTVSTVAEWRTLSKRLPTWTIPPTHCTTLWRVTEAGWAGDSQCHNVPLSGAIDPSYQRCPELTPTKPTHWSHSYMVMKSFTCAISRAEILIFIVIICTICTLILGFKYLSMTLFPLVIL